MGIVLFDEADLPVSPPTFRAFFETDGRHRLTEPRVENEPVHTVLLRETGNFPGAMFGDAALKAVGDADVERAMLAAGENVDPVGHGRAPRLWVPDKRCALSGMTQGHRTFREHIQ